MLFVWSQSQDETVIQDLSGLGPKPSDLFRSDERDHNGNSELDGTSTIYEDMLTNIESGPSSPISCEKVDDFEDSDGELEALVSFTKTADKGNFLLIHCYRLSRVGRVHHEQPSPPMVQLSANHYR